MTETYYWDDGRIFTRQQMIERNRLEENIVTIVSPTLTWNMNIALFESDLWQQCMETRGPIPLETTSATGYIDCPTHGVVDSDPCPICLKKGRPQVRKDICPIHKERLNEIGLCKYCHPPAICYGCGITMTVNYYNREDQIYIFCRDCACKVASFPPNAEWDEFKLKELDEHIPSYKIVLHAEKDKAIKEHGCIQEPGSNPAVAMDGLASFVRRRVILDIKQKRQKGGQNRFSG